MEELNLLSLNDDNIRTLSGGYGYTDKLPGEDFDPEHVRTRNLWGLTYYGCCEPLDGRMDLIRQIPNLRKVSISPWINVDRAVREVGSDYVFSYKPNPVILAEDKWQPERAPPYGNYPTYKR